MVPSSEKRKLQYQKRSKKKIEKIRSENLEKYPGIDIEREAIEFSKEYIFSGKTGKFNSNATKRSFWYDRGAENVFDQIDIPISEFLYRVIYKEEGICKSDGCTNKTKFESFKHGYRKFCSRKCAQNDQNVKSRKEQTTLDRYGSKTVLGTEKSKNGMIKKYGVDNPAKLDFVKEKIKKSKLKLYGDENFNNHIKANETREKNGTTHKEIAKIVSEKFLLENGFDICKIARDSFYKKYGANPSTFLFVHNKKKTNSIEKYGVHFQARHIGIDGFNMLHDISYIRGKSIRQIASETGYHESHVSKKVREFGIRTGFRSSIESEILSFVRSIYNGKVLTNTRSVIDGELDIFIPELNFAIEVNGDYWHCDKFYKTHKIKFDKCKEKGIYLLQIFEHELYDNRKMEIYKSKISLKLGMYNRRIYARKCKIVDVSPFEASNFLERNHLDGKARSSLRYGLEYDGELVSLMTFGISRFSKNEYELIRFANDKNSIVVGGASKLLSHFVKNNSFSKIISFSNNLYSDGALYDMLGFKYVGYSQGYFYVKNRKRYSRFQMQKHKLPNRLAIFDPNLSESENVKSNGFLKIYDAGQSKWEFSV